MAEIHDKENLAPLTSIDPLHRKNNSLSPKKSGRKGRSKSIGPGALDDPEPLEQSAKDRRKSAFIPATRSILSKDEETARAARRKSMMNRRVSFAPEATLHTWDIIVDAKDQTTSTDSADSTRRASSFDRTSSSPGPSSDASQEDEDAELLSPPTSVTSSRGGQQKQKRRSSGIPPMNFNNPEDAYSSGISGSEDESGSDADGDSDSDGDTGMSLDVDEVTMQSAALSDNSTGSSERLETALREAATIAGTRGIEFDEFGDMSMEIAGDEVTNAFKPWAQRQPDDALESASLNQENINPFSPAFKADVAERVASVDEENEDDMSMDVTHAIGGILKGPPAETQSSPMSDATMELTQAVGKITGQKRRRSAIETGSPAPTVLPKRTRSSMARTSMGDDTMDLTMAVGGILSKGSPVKPDRRRSFRRRRSSGVTSEPEEATMEFTQAVGGIQPTKRANRSGDDSFDGNEELSMELTTVLGGINPRSQPASADNIRPVTPQTSQSPIRSAANTTPKDQERFKEAPDLTAKKLLTPILQQEADTSSGKKPSVTNVSSKGKRLSVSPAKSYTATTEASRAKEVTPLEATGDVKLSPGKEDVTYPILPTLDQKPSPVKTPMSSPLRLQGQQSSTKQHTGHVDVQLQAPEQSPTVAKQHRTTPAKGSAATPEKVSLPEDSRDLTSSMRLLTTPRKEPLKSVTPRKQAFARQASPVKAMTPKIRATPKVTELTKVVASPVRRLREDLEKIKTVGQQAEKIGLQDFLAKAGVRFMDLTTTKRRMTAMPTPSKARASSHFQEDVDLESGVVAAACTVPELELYQHACHELKRYTKEGKQMISDLEETTLRDQPPLIRAYMHAHPDRRLALDAQMRDMKTEARIQSKEMWYAWRSQLLDELMVGQQKIGEGMIKDDELIGRSEEILELLLPALLEKHTSLQQEADRLEQIVNAVPEEEKEELHSTRHTLQIRNDELRARRRKLEALRQQVEEQDSAAEHLRDSKHEFTAVIQEANRVREACRGVSLDEIAAWKGMANATTIGC